MKNSSKDESNCVITLPFEDICKKTEIKGIKLKGRTMKTSKPINYNDLFNTNKKNSSKARENHSNSKMKILNHNKRINDNIEDNKKQKNKEHQVICSIDELFDKYIYKTEIPQLDK